MMYILFANWAAYARALGGVQDAHLIWLMRMRDASVPLGYKTRALEVHSHITTAVSYVLSAILSSELRSCLAALRPSENVPKLVTRKSTFTKFV